MANRRLHLKRPVLVPPEIHEVASAVTDVTAAVPQSFDPPVEIKPTLQLDIDPPQPDPLPGRHAERLPHLDPAHRRNGRGFRQILAVLWIMASAGRANGRAKPEWSALPIPQQADHCSSGSLDHFDSAD